MGAGRAVGMGGRCGGGGAGCRGQKLGHDSRHRVCPLSLSLRMNACLYVYIVLCVLLCTPSCAIIVRAIAYISMYAIAYVTAYGMVSYCAVPSGVVRYATLRCEREQ